MGRTLDPLGQRVVVRRMAHKEIRGIMTPQTAQKRCLVGVVMHKGPEAVWVNVGDLVLFATFSGFEPYLEADMKDFYDDCLIMNCYDILCKVKEEQNAPMAVSDVAVSGNGVR